MRDYLTDLTELNSDDDAGFSLAESQNVRVEPLLPSDRSPVTGVTPVAAPQPAPETGTRSQFNVPKPPQIKLPPKAATVETTLPQDKMSSRKFNKAFPSVDTPTSSTGWEDVAVALKKLIEYPNQSVMHIAIEGETILIVDPQYKAFSWTVPLNDFPTRIGSSSTRLEKVGPNDPAALQGAGQDLAPLLWLVGVNAFDGQPAPWLRKNERYKLMRWPNLTEFNLSLDQIYITSIIGSTPASIDELVVSSGASAEEVANTINALSLMGILSVHPYQGSAGGFKFKRKGDGLFAKLRKKIGW